MCRFAFWATEHVLCPMLPSADWMFFHALWHVLAGFGMWHGMAWHGMSWHAMGRGNMRWFCVSVMMLTYMHGFVSCHSHDDPDVM